MASNAVGPDPSAGVQHEAASSVDATAPADRVAAGLDMAIGYEAADPALHAPLWTEAMRDASHRRR